ncbi:hypothetical protein CES85_5255 [Ochrobactrum quorumnocens]|uniref:Uncharacterized protein n=1 Tax=Ochrobactrum quorumnocens TaxID=271865 RepID=A0A248UDJ1_9HYPH|nr:hypothetical protein CES85_5255 [[Ochrobactrum] quorumnocens]
MFNARPDHVFLLNSKRYYLSCCLTDLTRLLLLTVAVNTLVNLTSLFRYALRPPLNLSCSLTETQQGTIEACSGPARFARIWSCQKNMRQSTTEDALPGRI